MKLWPFNRCKHRWVERKAFTVNRVIPSLGILAGEDMVFLYECKLCREKRREIVTLW